MAEEAYYLTREDVEFIRELRLWQRNLRGDGITNTTKGATIARVANAAPCAAIIPQRSPIFRCRITGIFENDGDNHWIYRGELVIPFRKGRYQLPPPSQQATSNYVINPMEAANSTAGPLGPGWRQAGSFPPTVTLQPINIGAVVFCQQAIDCDTNPFWEIVSVVSNVAQGPCNEPEE